MQYFYYLCALNRIIKRMEIAELGEFGLIKHLTKDIKTVHKSTQKGVGDDTDNG